MAPEIIPQCSDQFPFVLLPVRMETKYKTGPSGTELRIRFYPDALSVASAPVDVNDAERTLGQNYWRARAAFRQTSTDDNLKRAYQGSWKALATRAGAYRAGFVVRSTAPLNPDAAAGDLNFPAPTASGPPPLPQAEGLPDSFLVIAYFRDPTTRVQSEVARVRGAPIPAGLVLGPDPTQSSASVSRDPTTGRLIVPDSLRWLVDFDAAVQVGMAVRMPLSPPFNTRGLDRMIALGVRTTSSFPNGSDVLEQLFQKHRDTDGFALVGAGTPTNNTEVAVSGWQPASSQIDELFDIENSPLDLGGDGPLQPKDGERFADLFGLSTDLVRRLPGAAATDISEAINFNRAAASGTIGDFMREYLKGWVDPATADAVHDFFTTSVSGRGLFPAFRAGRQPYGIVLTSSWSDWKQLATTSISVPSSDVTQRLLRLLTTHRPRWELLADRAPHAALPTADPFQRLLGILGLLASSTDFVSRKAVSDEYIRQRLQFAGAQAPATQAWLNALIQTRTAGFNSIDLPPTPGPSDPLLAFIVFLDQFDEWKLPLVDGDPGKPLSETALVAKYDGTHTYLDWLSAASPEDLSNQAFKDATGAAMPAPAALLYVLLRQSLLAALESSSLQVAAVKGKGIFDVPDRDPPIANIGDQQNVLRKDYLNLDASKLGLTTQPIPLVDWVLAQARTNSSASVQAVQRLAEVQQAIAALTGLPTARLERLLAEHIDLCCYRLDAWVTGLYAHRFAVLRQQSDVRGFYLGAYGWLENVRPSGGQLQQVPPESLPALLRAGVNSDVFEDPTNAGYIHAPSVMQAATAAVLRNGYLSHASSEQPSVFSVNLSSARMRIATSLMDGVRNGQPLAALLGYQFERGLHEGHSGIELDSFIYAFRDQFPLLGGRLTPLPPNTPAEVVEARNVVDGLALLQAASQAYPYGVAGLPALPNPAASAIITEVDRLKDALDAVSDLLLSESVYQVVQGNTPRLQGTLQALTAPEAPPEPEILRTPRSGRLFSFRVNLALDPDGSGSWSPTRSSRARANPALNHWLTTHLPAAHSIQWTVHAPGQQPAVQSLSDLQLEPIDLVLMSGDQLGDRSSELERYLIRRYRWEKAISNSVPTVIAQPGVTPSDPQHSLILDWGGASPGAASLASTQPLLLRWRRLISQTRAMHAGDWRRTNTAQGADAQDPAGSATGHPRLLQFADLLQRLDAAGQELSDATIRLNAAADTLAASAANLNASPNLLNDPAFRSQVEGLIEALFTIELFGIPEATPVETLPLEATVVAGILSQAQVVLQIAKDRSNRAATLRQTAFPDPVPAAEPAQTTELARRNDVLRRNYIDAAKAIFGSSFGIVPLYRLPADQVSEIQQAATNSPVTDPLVIHQWLHSTSRVRPRIADIVISLAAARWLGHPIEDPTIVQLPHQPGRPWIGGTIDPSLPPSDWLSMVLWNAALLPKPVQAGLIVDGWTETVPAGRETTGVAFHYNRPNAMAPQAVLLAVPATQLGHWTWDGLIGSVNEGLDLAKIRAVEPDTLIGTGPNARPPEGAYFQTLPAILTEMTRTRFAATDFAKVVVAAST